MFEKTEVRRSKSRIMVRLCLNDGAIVEGDVFVINGQRMQDLLNDERNFLPVDEGGGIVTMVAKGAIARASTIGDTPVIDGDPYDILKIEQTASIKEVREAWMKRLKASHPDRLAAMQLDGEIINTARKVCQRINAAYDTIVRERKSQASS